MTSAFRRPVDDKALQRYTIYTIGKIGQGVPFSSHEKASSAILSSPLFFIATTPKGRSRSPHVLASNLSYFLWASCPDDELLSLASKGELERPDVLARSIDRMLADPKIERFLDAFPAQWMQLENILAATPDPKRHKYFSFDNTFPASLQMLMEPLLLFDAVYVENRPVIDLVAPDFGYQSDLLKTWYAADPLVAPKPDTKNIEAENRANNERRKELEGRIKQLKADLENHISPIRNRLLEERKNDVLGDKPVDLTPYAALGVRWKPQEFEQPTRPKGAWEGEFHGWNGGAGQACIPPEQELAYRPQSQVSGSLVQGARHQPKGRGSHGHSRSRRFLRHHCSGRAQAQALDF